MAAPNTPDTEGALGPYLRALSAHKFLVLLSALACVGGAIAWLSLRTPDYEASAEILVTPLSQGDATYIGLPLLRDAGDPTRTVQTAATLISSTVAAETVAEELELEWDGAEVLERVKVEAKGESSVLAVTARAEDAKLAQDLANTFAQSSLATRRERIQDQVERALDRLEDREAAADDPETRLEIGQRISALEELREGTDPTLSIAELATVPKQPIGAPPWLVVALSLIAGLLVGTGTALALELTNRRIREEDELLSIYPLPVLARVPIMPRRLRRAGGASMTPAVREAFRTLQAQLEVRGGAHRTIMVTSASRNDGKTSCTISLALSLAAGGYRVVLIDFDLRKPDVAKRLHVDPGHGLMGMLREDARFKDLLVTAPQLPLLRVISAGGAEGDVALLEALLRRLPQVIEEASTLADYVIIDTAPLGEVSDALKIAPYCDDVLVVARPGNTNRVNLQDARDLLESTGRTPAGYVLVGERPGGSSAYYAYGTPRSEAAAARRPLARR